MIKKSSSLKRSKRNELEIIDLLNMYKKTNSLRVELLGRGAAWLDTGTIDDFNQTSIFVSSIEKRQGFKIASLEEISLMKKWINKNDIKKQFLFMVIANTQNILKVFYKFFIK